MRDWRPDIRIAERYEEPYERQVAKDLVKVEKLRQRAIQRPDEKAVSRLGLAAYFALFAVVLAVLVVSFDHMNVRTEHRQKELAMRTCMMINHQHWEQYKGFVYASRSSRAAHMDNQAKRYLILAKNAKKSMSDCRH